MPRTISTGRQFVRWVIIATLIAGAGGCEKIFDKGKPPTDAVAIFEELWKLMDQRYALFNVKGVDWNAVHTEFLAKVSGDMNEQALFLVLNDMLSTLKDGHVVLMSPTDTAVYDGFYTGFPANFNYEIVVNNYLHNDYQVIGPLMTKIVNNVGYIYYSSFNRDLTEEDAARLMQAMSQTKGLILDLRNNTGGDSRNTSVLFSRFITEKTLVKYEKRKSGTGHNEFLTPEPYFINAASVVYGNRLVVLTNRSCFSACNDFVLFASQLPKVTLMGDQTGGGGSIPYQYILGNGWKIQYSGTVTLSAEQQPVETGILPDKNITITSIDQINGKDPIIEQAFQWLQ